MMAFHMDEYMNKPLEIKQLLEVAKLNDVTIDDALFAKLFDKIYEPKPIDGEIKVTTETIVEKV